MAFSLIDESVLRAFEQTPELRIAELERLTVISRRTLQRSLWSISRFFERRFDGRSIVPSNKQDKISTFLSTFLFYYQLKTP